MTTPFGFSLALDEGDLVLDGGALREVHDLDNLVQALTVRLRTPFGSDRFDTTYGLDVRRALTGPHGRGVARELLRLDLVRTLATDPRVAEVREVLFTESGRTSSVEIVVETVAGTTVTVFADLGPGRAP